MPRRKHQTQAAALAQLQALQSQVDVASFLGTSIKRLTYHLFVRKPAYRRFLIPKKDGTSRQIGAPKPPVVLWQRILASVLTDAYSRKKGAFGFCNGGGIVANAARHKSASVVLNLDLKDFFGSIHFGRVRGVFEGHPFGLPRGVATVLAQLCCHNRVLPQGAPTSPILTNYVCRGLDTKLARLAKQYRCQYTRYADDISFSSRAHGLPSAILKARTGRVIALGEELLAVIGAENFEVNYDKVWVRTKRERQSVTGLVVNEKVNVQKTFRRRVRAALHNWEKNGWIVLEEHYVRMGGQAWDLNVHAVPPVIEHLRGKVDFLRQVRGKDDPMAVGYAIALEQLCTRDGFDFRPVRVFGRAALDPKLLAHGVFVVTAHDRQGNCVWNGTAWALHGGALITNAHVTHDSEGILKEKPVELVSPSPQQSRPRWLAFVLGLLSRWFSRPRARGSGVEFSKENDDGPVELRLRRAADPVTQFAVAEVVQARLPEYDVARLVADIPLYAVFLQEADDPIAGEEVLLAGFPNWRHQAEKCRTELGRVNHIRTISGLRWLEISPRIRPGNSGGPVFGARGTVIGIATMAEGGVPVPNAALSVTHIKEVL